MNLANLQTILKQKMTRKEFLVTLGVLVIALIGISGLIEKITKTQPLAQASKPKRDFGSGAYGA